MCDKVIKNHDTLVENDFDSCCRDLGVDIIVEQPFSMDDNEIDVICNNVSCFETVDNVIKNEDKILYYLRNNDDSTLFLIKEFGHSPFYSPYDQFLEINVKDKKWNSVSFMVPTPGFPKVVTKNIISVLLRKNKILKLNENV